MSRNKIGATDAYGRPDGASAVLTEMPPREIELADGELAKVRDEIRKTIAQGAVAIVQHAIARAIKDGQFQLIKFLFEIAGLYPLVNKGSEAKELSLARLLCRQLGLPESPELENKIRSKEAKDAHPTECRAVK
jgi:hypothetical protein